MTDRRAFLSTVTGSLAGMALGPVAPHGTLGAIAVSAEPTVFWSNPDGRSNLVRFLATGTDAPAGRLRVYDRARRLLGTAGMLRIADELRGELWLRLDEPTSILSELEAPGRRTPLRTRHRLLPPEKWTVVWLTVVDSDELVQRVHELPPLDRLVLGAIWRDAGVVANPLPASARLHEMAHVPFPRVGVSPATLPSDLHLPTATVALVDSIADYPVTTPLALSGSGVQYVVRRKGSEPLAWWIGPDGSRVLAVALPPNADPQTLGFADARTVMERRLEAHLHAATLRSEDATTVIAQTRVSSDLPHMVAAVREWNRRYAYPHITIGDPDDLGHLAVVPGADTPEVSSSSTGEVNRPSIDVLVRVAEERTAASDHHAESILAPIAALLEGSSPDAAAAQQISALLDTRVPGWLIVNPSPFRRTDAVRLPDGRLQVVTDVPSLGYAFVLDAARAPESSAVDPSSALTLRGAALDLGIDPITGSLRSIRERRTRREWLRRAGTNDAAGARLELTEQRIVPDVGMQAVSKRSFPNHGERYSIVTAYDDLPWIDIEHRTENPERERFDYTFDFALVSPTVRWGIPAGHQEGRPPLRYIPVGHWLVLDGENGSILISGSRTPYAGIGLDGRVNFPGAVGRSRFRIQTTPAPPSIADCTRFGWGAEPLRAVGVAGSASGSADRFGHAVVLDQTDAALVALRPAADGDGIVAYVQNLTAERRFVTLGFGLLMWAEARRIDLREQEIAERTSAVPEGVTFDLPGWGVAGVRLTRVRLRGR